MGRDLSTFSNFFLRSARAGLAVVLAAAAAVGVLVPTAGPAAAATIAPGLADDVVASGFTLPSGLAFLPDGRILVTEKDGLVRVVKNGTLLSTPFADLRSQVNSNTDRGLTGIAIDPSFATNGYVYLMFPRDTDGTDGAGPVTGGLLRVTASGDTMVAGSGTFILGSVSGAGCVTVTPACIPQDILGHAVDSLRFADDGTLFVSIGDSASWDFVDDRALRSQDVNQYTGKILHITKDGLGIATNPFWDGNANSIRSRVYAYGFRNPFRMSVRPGTNTLYVGDVGWNDVEESDVVTAGGNYGWPCYEGSGQQSGYALKPTCQALYAAGPSAVRTPLIQYSHNGVGASIVGVGSSRVDLQACKLEYSIVSPK